MVVLNEQEILKCYEFGLQAWNNKSQSLKSHGEEERTREQFIANQLTGKLSEIIFKKQIESEFPEYKVILDFEHYQNKHHIDNGDVKILRTSSKYEIPIKLDIKGSSSKAKWLLVEDFKYDDTINTEMKSEKYIMVEFKEEELMANKLTKDLEKVLTLKEVTGEIKGWAWHKDFMSSTDNEPWFIYKRGDRLKDPFHLPANFEDIKNKIELHESWIDIYNRNLKKYSFSKKFLNIELKANVNYGLPIKWLRPVSEELFEINI